MLQKLRKLLGRTPQSAQGCSPKPLLGVPAIRRVKTYAADTGYTWSYTFEGYRLETAPAGRVYLFSLWSGSRTPNEIGIVVADAVTGTVAQQAGREIEPRECYALAKMHLFAVLDAESSPPANARFSITEQEALAIWERLDL